MLADNSSYLREAASNSMQAITMAAAGPINSP
jgi:hypothetical protein